MPFNQITIQDLTGLDYQPEDFILLKSSDGVTTTSTTTTSTTVVFYAYGGTVNQYATSGQACLNQTCGRDYYLATPSWTIGNTVYNNSALTSVFNGGGNWIAVATSTGTYCGGGWAAIQVNSLGVITGFIGC